MLIALISLFFLLLSLLIEWTPFYVIAVIIIFMSNVMYAIAKIKEHITFLLFHISVFTLWLARIFFSLINREQTITEIIEYYGVHTFILIYITLLAIRIGYVIMKRKSSYIHLFNIQYKETSKIKSIEYVSLALFLITLLPKLYIVMDKVRFVQENSYVVYYLEYTRSYPRWIEILGTMNEYCFFTFLATMPTKKRAIPVIIVYLVMPTILLFAGRRNELITELFMIVWYMFFREQIASNKENGDWVNKKIIITAILCFPLLIAFMELLAYIRVGETLENKNIYSLIVDFFVKQSGSVEHLRNITSIASEFPEPHWRYFFQPVINLLTGNTLTSKIFNFREYKQHTVEAALYAFNYGQTYTYIIMPHNYLAGIGLGGNYLSETYLSLGYIGVIIYNLFIGVILRLFSIVRCRRWYVFAVWISILGSIFYLPREMALAWIVKGFNLTALGTYFLIYLTASLFSKYIKYENFVQTRATKMYKNSNN